VESLFLFPETEDTGSTDPTDIGCVWPGCGKIPAPDSPHCPYHILIEEWKRDEPNRRKRRADLVRDMKRQKDESLAASPLRADNPQFLEPPQKRRAKPRPKSNRRAALQAEKERTS
jgi:hypothetical protein